MLTVCEISALAVETAWTSLFTSTNMSGCITCSATPATSVSRAASTAMPWRMNLINPGAVTVTSKYPARTPMK